MASSAAVEHEQAEELEDCVTYQHVKLLESAGIGECLFIFSLASIIWIAYVAIKSHVQKSKMI